MACATTKALAGDLLAFRAKQGRSRAAEMLEPTPKQEREGVGFAP
jgi:hypothetical protein